MLIIYTMPRKSKDTWNELVNEHKSGKSVRQIMDENPEVKKTSLRYHINKANKDSPDDEVTSAPETQTVQKPVVDSFLNTFNEPKTTMSHQRPMGTNLVDQLFSDELFLPETLNKVAPKPAAGPKSIASKPLSWWSNTKTKPTIVDKHASENENLELVQKIRLYFVHFPELAKLHIVTRKKGTDTPDTEKWLISLYSKKTLELEKILNFVKFHTRNSLNENSSIKMASNVLETGVKILEHTLMLVGVKGQGLTKNVMEDEDILRCVKELLIDNSITSMTLGTKSDLLLKLGMKIMSQDTNNRIEEKMMSIQAQREAQKSKLKQADEEEAPELERLDQTLLDKYEDL